MLANLTLISCLLLPGDPLPTPLGVGDFKIRAEPITVMEGGPFIIKVTLTYCGSKPLTIQKCFPSKSICCKVPDHWLFQVRISGAGGLRSDGSFTMKSGHTESESLFLHHKYANITQGKETLHLTWPIYEPGDSGRLLARPSTSLTLDVPPADAKHLALLRKKLEKMVDRDDFSQKDWWEVKNHLRYTKHSALTPVVWRLIEKDSTAYQAPQVVSLLYELSEPPHHAINSRFVDLISDQGWEHANVIFGYWQATRTVLPVADFDKLVHSKYVSAKLLTYITFPQQCEKEWGVKLIEECRNLTRPVPSAIFSRLLRDLDDDDFKVRQKASNRLEQLGDRVRPQLTRALQTALSAEARLRVRSVLDKIQLKPYSPGCDQAIRYLGNRIRSPEADAVLAALAEGNPGLWLTDYAKTVLREREKPPSGK